MELEDVRKSYETGISVREYVGRSETYSLQQIYAALSDLPTSPSSMTAISCIWNGLATLEKNEAETSLNLRQQRKCVMSTNFGAWFWLDTYIAQQSKSIMKGLYMGEKGWLTKLVDVIKTMREIRATSKVFKAQDFDKSLPPQSYTYHGGVVRWDRDPEEEAEKVASIVIEILQNWLGFPMGSEANDRRRKARFVEVIIGEFGVNALLLDQTWKAYNLGKRRMFLTDSPNAEGDVDPLRVAARAHTLNKPNSPEKKILEDIGCLCKKFTDIAGTGSDQINTPTVSTRLIQSSDEARISRFVRYIREMVNMQTGRTAQDKFSRLQKAVYDNKDKMLPFRECAPSRIRFSGADGPYAPHTIRTRSGLFSALIWRAITFTSPFSHEHKMVFQDLDDWKGTIERAGMSRKPTSYFCNTSAYGVNNSFRGIELADIYWKATGEHDWSKFLGNDLPGFNECYMDFLKPGKTPAIFPQMGPLCAFLMSADCVYGGALSKPTMVEIGQAVKFINRGAAQGLEHMGLIDVRKKTANGKSRPAEHQAVEGVEKVYEILEKEISPEDWEELQVDEIMVENTLCKYSKAIKRNLI